MSSLVPAMKRDQGHIYRVLNRAIMLETDRLQGCACFHGKRDVDSVLPSQGAGASASFEAQGRRLFA